MLAPNFLDAINDDFTSTPLNSSTGGITPSIFSNDLYNGSLISSATVNNITVNIVNPSPVLGASINNQGVLSIPAGTPDGSYTFTYKIETIGNCDSFDIASIIVYVSNFTPTPNISSSIRANNGITIVDLQSTNKIIISGYFTKYNNISKNRFARLNNDLTLDTSFLSLGPTPTSQPPSDLAIQSDDKIIVVGGFSGFSGGTNGYGLARLNVDGSIDTSFNTGGTGISLVNYVAYTCAIQQNGKILIGGRFGSYNGVNCGSLIRLNSNGTIDSSFSFPNYPSSWVHKILIQPDGKILVEGRFGYAYTDSTNRHLIRLNSDGSLDNTFTSGYTGPPTGYTTSVAYSGVITLQNMLLQADGKIIITGAFNNYNGLATNNILRLLPNGDVDTTFFTYGTDRAIYGIDIEPSSNKIIISGEFTTFNGNPVPKIIRLNTNGTLDNSFNVGLGSMETPTNTACFYCFNYIQDLKRQTDGKIIIGGHFTSFNNITAGNITRIYGNAGLQAKNEIEEYQSEPEKSLNKDYRGITIYPNPSDGIYYFNLTEEDKDTQIQVFNLLGEQVFNGLLVGKEENKIDLSNLAKGCYLVKLSNTTTTTTQKLIKN